MTSSIDPKGQRAASDAKAPLDYLEPLVGPPVARVLKHGADKYGYRNYTIAPCHTRTYIGASQRHLDAIKAGEDVDPDSGESHWAHIIASGTCYLACELSGRAVDDRAAQSTPLSDHVHRNAGPALCQSCEVAVDGTQTCGRDQRESIALRANNGKCRMGYPRTHDVVLDASNRQHPYSLVPRADGALPDG